MTSSPGPSVTVVSYGTSGGVVSYTVYRIEVSLGNERWTIYRRYKLFSQLNDKLSEIVDIGGSDNDKSFFFQNVSRHLPPKKFPNGESVVKARLITLNDYLMAVMQFRPSAVIKSRVEILLNDFFDVTHKGQSGLALAFPLQDNNIIKEQFIRLKLTGSLFFGNYYVGVTKTNTLYVCKKIYDTPGEASFMLQLDSQGGQLKPSFQEETTIILKGNDVDVCFDFGTKEDAASWYRVFTAACIKPVLGRIDSETRRKSHMENERRKQEERERAAQDEARSLPKQDIHLGSTGVTADLMSANYGV
jgi:hypothetical protein